MAKRRTSKDIVRTEKIGEHTIPFYRITTADGIEAIVPKYIRRVFSEKRGSRGGVKGWQIAYLREDFGRYNPFFADGENGPQISLEQAIRDLRRFLRATPDVRRSRLRVRDTKGKIHKTGMAGVRLRWDIHRSRCIYQLSIEVRAGAYSPSTADLTYAGTEFSLTEDSLKTALRKGVQFRHMHITNQINQGYTFAPLRGRRPKLSVDLHRAFELLKHQKNLDHEKVMGLIEKKVRRWSTIKRNNLIFRKNNITSTRQIVRNRLVKVPDFIEFDGDEWVYEYPLSDGALYGGSYPLSADPQEDIIEIMTECLHECAMSIIPVPVDRLYEETPRYASMPLNVIEEMNQSSM